MSHYLPTSNDLNTLMLTESTTETHTVFINLYITKKVNHQSLCVCVCVQGEVNQSFSLAGKEKRESF